MKLRNKKTGEVYTACSIWFDESIEGLEKTKWRTLKEFCADWEDYELVEPLIKDEKVCKAVQAWAEAESIPTDATVFYNGDEYSLGWYHSVLEFSKPIQGLEEKEYTIAELCGKDEE